jgi:RHS repeat-associated protein
MAEVAAKEPVAKVSGKVSVGHPVDVATGALTHDFEDYVLPGRMPLVFGRRYSSAMPARPDGLFGPGWSCPFQMYLHKDLDGYHLLAEDGETLIPFDDANGALDSGHALRNPGMFHELRRDGARFVVTRWNPDTQEVVRYVFAGRSEAGPWPLSGRYTVSGQGIEVERDPKERILALRQRREGRGLRLVYDPSGRLAEVLLTARAHERLILRYRYDSSGRLCEMVDALGQRCAYEYDDQGRMLREVNLGGMVYHFRFDSGGRCIETTGLDGYGRNTLQIEERARITQVTDALDQVTLYKWNESGQVEEQISPLGNVAKTAYDEEGRIVAKTDPTGATTEYKYDERGDRIEVTSPTGAVTRYEYDAHHQVICVTDPTGGMWRRSYNDAGQIAAVTNPLEQSLLYSYDAGGDLLEVRDTAGRTRRYGWDRAGSLASSTDPLGHRTQYEYDAEGELTAVIDPRGHRTELLRDALSRVHEVKLPDGARRRFGRDAYGQVTQYVDELGAVTKRRYAACGLLVEEIRPHGGRIQLEWSNIPGQLLAVRNELGERHTFDYDAQGRMIRQVNFAGHPTRYEYEKGDKVSVIHDAAGNKTRFERNPSGAVTAVIPSNGSKVLYEYDLRGLLTKADNGDCPIEREYDALGRIVRERQGRHEVVSEYDAAGNRCRRKSSLGHETVFEWDDNSQLAVLWQDDLAPIRFEYDAAGNEISRSIRDGVRITHDYDSRDRRSEQRVQKGAARMGQVRVGGEVLGFRKYNYDAASNLTEIFDEQQGATRYQYDAAGRIVSAHMPDGFSERFTYDAADNIRRIERAAAAISDDRPLPLLQQFDYARGNVLKSGTGGEYEYNVLGQQVRKREGNKESRYFWNTQGMLAKVLLSDGAEWTYRYDPLGRRVEKRGPAERVEFVWDGDVVLHEVHAREEKIASAIHWEFDPYGFAPIEKVEQSKHYLCVNQVNGAPRELLGDDGHVAWRDDFSAIGASRSSRKTDIDCPVRFQGQWFDQENDLHYNRYRYFDPNTNRYISRDPIGLQGDFNDFSYASNPIGWMDPFGLANTPCDHLNEALGQQNLSAPPNNYKQKWSKDGYDYEVRIHPANPVHGKTGNIFRVARRKQGVNEHGQGSGWEYQDHSGNWHHESTLKPTSSSYNAQAAADTHIPVTNCFP